MAERQLLDEARRARLLELARKAWGDVVDDVLVFVDGSVEVVTAAEVVTAMGFLKLSVDAHPRAVDALEAALVVLAGEQAKDLSAAERAALFVHGRDKDRIEAQHQRIAELEMKLRCVRAWAERGEDLPLSDLDNILDDKDAPVRARAAPAWVEELAREWEKIAGQWRNNHEHYDGEEECEPSCNAEAKQVERCAAELRKRAKGGT